jgi:hypothetical protein
MYISFANLISMRLAFFIFLAFLFLPLSASSAVVINEIMYDLEGADDGREWVEIFNNGNEPIDLAGWKFYENGTNHKISLVEEDDDFIIPAGIYAVIADNPDNFLIDWPGFSGVVFDSSFSLKNTGEVIALRDAELNDIDSVIYNSEWGASGDGNSLQKMNGEWTMASPTPGEQNSVMLTPGVNESQISEPEHYDYVPLEDLPKIKAYAGEGKTMIVGATGEFRGEAFGLDDKPLERARYLWNFGDGSLKEGQNITHFYRYPGEYLVVLDVSSGSYSASDRLTVRVVPNEIFISEIKTGVDSFIELENRSKEEINISSWRFRAGHQTFTFSKNSFIKPHSYLVIPIVSSGMLLAQGKGLVELLYPGGFLTDTFKYNGALLKGQSFSRSENGGDSVITPETPGKKNLELIVERIEETKATQKPKIKKAPAPRPKASEVEAQTLPDVNVGKNQEANIVIATEESSGRTKLYYFAVAFGLAFLASFGVFIIRRQRGR